jgi:hypothetical protein
MISGDNPPKYCRWCGTRMPAPGMHEGSFKSETDCELEAVKSKLDEQVRLREMAESFLRTAIEINEKNTSRLDRVRRVIHDEDMWAEAKYLAICSVLEEHEALAEYGICGKCGEAIDGRCKCRDVERQVLKDGDLVEFEGKRYVLTDVERQLPECRNCGTPSKALTNGWCDGCMGMAIV